jgi:hypothetical protein
MIRKKIRKKIMKVIRKVIMIRKSIDDLSKIE